MFSPRRLLSRHYKEKPNIFKEKGHEKDILLVTFFCFKGGVKGYMINITRYNRSCEK